MRRAERRLTPGACLTVTQFDAAKGTFKIDAAPETLFRTNLGQLRVGDRVNCERAMAANARYGGHIVQGHVDTVAELRSVEPNGPARTLTLRLVYDPPAPDRRALPAPSQLAPDLVPKGYITLDGVALTLIDVSPRTGGALHAAPAGSGSDDTPVAETIEFTVMLIPHTQQIVELADKPLGARVNVEFDMVGKYVLRALEGRIP